VAITRSWPCGEWSKERETGVSFLRAVAQREHSFAIASRYPGVDNSVNGNFNSLDWPLLQVLNMHNKLACLCGAKPRKRANTHKQQQQSRWNRCLLMAFDLDSGRPSHYKPGKELD